MIRAALALVFGTMCAMVLVFTVLLAGLLYIPSGTAWLFAELAKRNLFSYQDLRGTVGRGLEVGSLTIKTAAGEVVFSNLGVTADLDRLAYGELHLIRLVASEVDVMPALDTDPSPDREPFALDFLKSGRPLLPVKVLVDRVSIQRLTLQTPDEPRTLRDIELATSVDRRGIGFTTVSLAYQQLQLRANGFAYLSPKLQANINVDWSSLLPDGEAIQGRVEVRANAAKLEIEQSTAQAITSAARIAVDDWLDQPQLAISGNLEALRWPLTDTPAVRANGVQLQLQGDLAGLEGTVTGAASFASVFAGGASSAAPGAPLDAQFALQARFARDSLEVASLRLVSPTTGNLEFSGALEWRDGFPRWQGHAEVQAFDATIFHELAPEQVHGELEVAGSFNETLRLKIDSDAVAGRLRGIGFDAALQAEIDDRGTRVEQLTARVGENRLQASGVVAENRLEVQFDLAAVAIEQVFPRVSGSMTVNGVLSGSPQRPTLKADAKGTDLRYAGFSVAGIGMQIELLEGVFTSDANRFAIEGFRAYGSRLDTLAVVAEGPLLRPRLGFEAAMEEAQLTAVAETGFSQQGSTGLLTMLALQGEKFGRWQLETPAAYTIYRDSWSLQQLCLDGSGDGRACFTGSGSGSGDAQAATLAATQLPMSLLNALGMLPVPVTGRLDFDASLQREGGADAAYFRVSQSRPDDPLVITINPQAKSQLRISALEAELGLDQQVLTGQIKGILNDTGTLNGQLEVKNFPGDQSPLAARLDYEITDLAAYATLLPEVDALTGRVSGSIALANTFQQPRFSAQLQLDIPRIYIKPLAIEWTDLEVAVTTLPDSSQQFQAALKAGEGRIEATGTLSLGTSGTWSSAFQISGERALLMDLPNQRVIATPALQVSASNTLIDVRGQLVIPEASLRVTRSPDRLELTADAIVHEANASAQAGEKGRAGPAINLNLGVIFGDQARFEAYGLKTGVTGKLKLTQRPGNTLLGQGELRLVDGEYRAYGQDLTIDRGIIQFSGLLSRPRVDLSATRTSGEVIAGLKVTGPVNNMQSRLFSEPALNDSDILSYILRGKPLRDTTAADKNAVSNAALSYAISQSTPITSKLSKLSGLDEVGIAADSGVESLGFTLGKYITPELYIRYGIGIVDNLSKLLVQYQISNRLFLETESGEGQSVDLIYRVD